MSKHKILVCDDELGIRESLNLILSEKYKVSFAQTTRAKRKESPKRSPVRLWSHFTARYSQGKKLAIKEKEWNIIRKPVKKRKRQLPASTQ